MYQNCEYCDKVRNPVEESVCTMHENNVNIKSNISNHSHLYKTNNKDIRTFHKQNERRIEQLLAVKQRRNTSIDEKRGVYEVFKNDVQMNDENEEFNYSAHQRRRVYKDFANKLMLSEYLVNLPTDFEYNWSFKLCPVGVRSLVVAQKGVTKVYNRNGCMSSEFESALPGGGEQKQSGFTILDCIFCRTKQVYYILDLIAWKSFSLVDCSTEFRFFFLKSKLDENPELSVKTKKNKFPFFELNAKPAQLPLIESALCEPLESTLDEKLDGVLFYHNEVDYRHGITALVGWLKPYMVPEILGIPVHFNYMQEVPSNYTSLVDYLNHKQSLTEKHNRSRKQRNKCRSNGDHNEVEMLSDTSTNDMSSTDENGFSNSDLVAEPMEDSICTNICKTKESIEMN